MWPSSPHCRTWACGSIHVTALYLWFLFLLGKKLAPNWCDLTPFLCLRWLLCMFNSNSMGNEQLTKNMLAQLEVPLKFPLKWFCFVLPWDQWLNLLSSLQATITLPLMVQSLICQSLEHMVSYHLQQPMSL
jgi:hypothetical protein